MKLLRLDIQSPAFKAIHEAVTERLASNPCTGDLSLTRRVLKLEGFAAEPTLSHFFMAGALCDCVLVSGFRPVSHGSISANRPADNKAAETQLKEQKYDT